MPNEPKVITHDQDQRKTKYPRQGKFLNQSQYKMTIKQLLKPKKRIKSISVNNEDIQNILNKQYITYKQQQTKKKMKKKTRMRKPTEEKIGMMSQKIQKALSQKMNNKKMAYRLTLYSENNIKKLKNPLLCHNKINIYTKYQNRNKNGKWFNEIYNVDRVDF